MKITIKKGDLNTAMQLAKEVFNPTLEEIKKYHKKEIWEQKLSEKGMILIGRANNNPAGFATCYEKKGNLHIWNVGVLEKYRNQGIWKKLYSELIKYAKESNYEKITINTYKEKFPQMYNFLIKNYFNEYRKKEGKSFFEKKI